MKARWALAMVVAMAIIAMGVNIFYTAHTQRDADRRWCALLTSLTADTPAPTTSRAIKISDELTRLERQLGCKKG